MKHLLLACTFFYFVPFSSFCQSENRVRITGIVYNNETKKPLILAKLVSYTDLTTHLTDTEGFFSFKIKKQDSIKIVSMGYKAIVMTAKDFSSTPGTDTIYLEPYSYQLNEVTVRANGQPIKLNLPENIGKNVDPNATYDRSVPEPSIGLIFSPSTLVQSIFSRKAKNQRRLRKNIRQEKERSLWQEVVTSGMIKDWIEIKDENLEDFIIFCNQRIQVGEEDNLLTLRNKVLKLWEGYKKAGK